jgi:molecular chaperone Hsp33
MFETSRLCTFLDNKNGVLIHFFDGTKLIHDLVITHHLNSQSLQFFRDSVLSFIPMIYFLKNNESMGIYMDSESPYYRLKIETNFAGHTRSLILPENIEESPPLFTGAVRITKFFPEDASPYTSVNEFKETPFKSLVNSILETSYQTPSKLFLSDSSDQSIMISKLPSLNVNQNWNDETLTIEQYFKQNELLFLDIFSKAPQGVEKIVSLFSQSSGAYLSSKAIQFFCPCSKERFLSYLISSFSHLGNELLNEEGKIEVKCDYCLKKYHYSPEELSRNFQ